MSDLNDPFNKEMMAELKDTDAAISAIGGFGSNEHMMLINGDANINAMKAVVSASNASCKSFVYVSTVKNNLPSFFLRGYFEGKKKAEDYCLKNFEIPLVIKPSFIYGTRVVTAGGININIPLWALGVPLKFILQIPPFDRLKNLPGCAALFVVPVSVEDVALLAAAHARGKRALKSQYESVVDAENIEFESKRVL